MLKGGAILQWMKEEAGGQKLEGGKSGCKGSKRDRVILIFLSSAQQLAYHLCTRDICWRDEWRDGLTDKGY